MINDEPNRACSVAFCKHSTLGSAGSQCHSGFVEPQNTLQSWKWECAYKVLDNHGSLRVWRLTVAETKHVLEKMRGKAGRIGGSGGRYLKGMERKQAGKKDLEGMREEESFW